MRTVSEMQAVISNTVDWDTRLIESPHALLIAENTLKGEEINFADALEGLSGHLRANYVQNKVYSSDIQGAKQTKALIKKALNEAPQLVLYNGHGSTSRLGKDNLYHASDAAVNQAISPAIWLPMSCYMTYFESTGVNTMAHQLLFSGKSVAISGAALLSRQDRNLNMGRLMLDGLTANASLGRSINVAKATINDPGNSVNWSLLGDPSIYLH